MTTTPQIDSQALEAFLAQAVTDAAAAMSVLLSHIGDRLGLYRAMSDSEPVTSAELARRTDTNERLVHEWLSNQAVGGYVNFDPETERFRLPPEHALALAEENSPALIQGMFDMVAAVYQDIDKEVGVFRTGAGLTWPDNHHSVFEATERSFRPGYRANLVQQWIPAVAGLHAKLTAGAHVADVGCGYGTATTVLAEAYPASTFVGYDYHASSVDAARESAARQGVADRVTFEVADASEITGPYDLITFFDAWHDMSDPVGAAWAAREALGPDGAVLLIEPLSHDRLEDSFDPLGRFGYAVSTLICVPCSISGGGPGLGAQAGETRTRELFTEAGFTRFRRALETPLNLMYEARP
ncbi:MAG: class I SAM-dependent methyltransferase [Microlunatus sp.]|nr:class I SAM-dependent methyltransferase [Microlunatus sp.]MDN5769555.1 class I SAM-dependent methyltransferase [Microlunatus sp.]MDN5804781.1 class I SAM-dependent methyltransferase [Microlunatus sp.]